MCDRYFPLRLLYVLGVTALLTLFSCSADKTSPSPNVIYILADDLGYGELGVYGQKLIETPHIDELARNGKVFLNHYAGAPVCAPSRYVLLTGKHPGHAYIRGNDEWNERGEVWNYEKVVNDPGLEGQRPIPGETKTIGHFFQSADYRTAVIGKWGLGAPDSESTPNKMGFDYFYGYNCQRQAHQLYPKHLWENDQKIWLNNEVVAPRTKLPENVDTLDRSSYSLYNQQDYAPAMMQQAALQFIERNKEQPFFLYYASPLPHLPLQVPEDYVNRYVDKLGEEPPYLGRRGYFPARYPNATYAGMISYLDDQVGELVAKLKEEGLYDNTIIMFSSDNGPTYTGGVNAEYFNSTGQFNNKYGHTKGFVYEGGIRVPMIVQWPGKITPSTTTTHISAFWDIMATMADIMAIDSVNVQDGISFLPTLTNGPSQEEHDYLYWELAEYGGQQAVRWQNWKGVRKNIRKGNLSIELYDLSKDPSESQNLAEQHPEIVTKIADIMTQEHESATVDRFKLEALGDKISK